MPGARAGGGGAAAGGAAAEPRRHADPAGAAGAPRTLVPPVTASTGIVTDRPDARAGLPGARSTALTRPRVPRAGRSGLHVEAAGESGTSECESVALVSTRGRH